MRSLPGLLRGDGFAKPNPQPMVPNPPAAAPRTIFRRPARAHSWLGCRPPTPQRSGRQMIGLTLQSSRIKNDETVKAFHVSRPPDRAYRAAGTEAGQTREPRVSVSPAASSPNRRSRSPQNAARLIFASRQTRRGSTIDITQAPTPKSAL